jgi:hypothetical protein
LLVEATKRWFVKRYWHLLEQLFVGKNNLKSNANASGRAAS